MCDWSARRSCSTPSTTGAPRATSSKRSGAVWACREQCSSRAVRFWTHLHASPWHSLAQVARCNGGTRLAEPRGMTKPLRACLAQDRFETASATQFRFRVSLLALALAMTGCAGDGSAGSQTGEHTADTETTHTTESEPLPAE